MRSFILNSAQYVRNPPWHICDAAFIEPRFYMTEVVQVAMDNARHGNNPNPMLPRLILPQDEELLLKITRFRNETEEFYYTRTLAHIGNNSLKFIIKQKVTINGEEYVVPGD